MKRFILVLVLVGAAVWAAVAVATPSQGQTTAVLATGAMTGDVAYNTGLAIPGDGITWDNRQYTVDQLPEFLKTLRAAGVTSLGDWLQLHPAVAGKFGMMPVGVLHSPEVVTQQATFTPGGASGWHAHPGFVTGTVVSGQINRYAPDCTEETFAAGQSFYETAAKPFILKNEGTVNAVVMVTLVVPTGTPKTGLRLDAAQPATCTK